MKGPGGPRLRTVDELIDIILKKLRANREILERSLHFGRLSWRTRKDGEIEVELEPKL